MNYQQQLRQPEWLLKRKEILFRDNYQCKKCFSTKELRIHHKKYIKGLKAWEYSNNDLITLCKNCHDEIHNTSDIEKYFNEWMQTTGKLMQESLFGDSSEVVIVNPNDL